VLLRLLFIDLGHGVSFLRFFEQIANAPFGSNSTGTFVEPLPPRWCDLLEVGTSGGVDVVDGFLIFVPALNYGGLNPPAAQFPAALNDIVALGFLEFEYTVQIKSRV